MNFYKILVQFTKLITFLLLIFSSWAHRRSNTAFCFCNSITWRWWILSFSSFSFSSLAFAARFSRSFILALRLIFCFYRTNITMNILHPQFPLESLKALSHSQLHDLVMITSLRWVTSMVLSLPITTLRVITLLLISDSIPNRLKISLTRYSVYTCTWFQGN